MTSPVSNQAVNCQDLIHNIQDIISDLRAFKTQKDKLNVDVTCLEDSIRQPKELQGIKKLLSKIQQIWQTCWQASNILLEKVRKILMVLQTTEQVDDALRPLEKKVSDNMELMTDSQSLRRQQHVFRDLKLSLESLEPSVITLKAEAEDCNHAAAKLLEMISMVSKDKSLADRILNTDGHIYSSDVQAIIDRWELALAQVEQKIDDIELMIPEIEASEARNQQFNNLKLRIEELRDQLEIIRKQIYPALQEKSPTVDSFSIETILHKANRFMSDLQALKESINAEYNAIKSVQLEQNHASEIKKSLESLMNLWSETRDVIQKFILKLEGWKQFFELTQECERVLRPVEAAFKQELQAIQEAKKSSTILRQKVSILRELLNHLEDNRHCLDSVIEQRDCTSRMMKDLERFAKVDPNVRDEDFLDNTVKDLSDRWNHTFSRLKASLEETERLVPMLEAQEHASDQCQLMTNRLNIIHERIKQIFTETKDKSVQKSQLDAIKMSSLVRQIQSYVTELEALLGQLEDVKRDLERIDRSTNSLPEVQNKFVQVHNDGLQAHDLGVALLQKLKILSQLLKFIQDLDTTLVPVEKVLTETSADKISQILSTSELKHHERLYNGLFETLSNYRETVEHIQAASRDCQAASNFLGPNDPDNHIYTTEAASIISRYNRAFSEIQDRLSRIKQNLPKVEKLEQNKNTHRLLAGRVDSLEKKLVTIHENVVSRLGQQISSEPASIEILARSLNNLIAEIESCGSQIQDLSHDIDEACKPSESPLPQTLQLKVKIQELRQLWVTCQTLAAALLQKIKALQAAATSSRTVENVLRPIENMIKENENTRHIDSGSMKRQLQVFASLQSTLDAQVETLDSLKEAGILNENAAAVIEQATNAKDNDLENSIEKIKLLVNRWASVQNRLTKSCHDLSDMIPLEEQKEQNNAKVKSINNQIELVSRRLEQAEKALKSRLTTRLPEDQSAIAQHIKKSQPPNRHFHDFFQLFTE